MNTSASFVEEFPGRFRVIFRQPCFLREGQMVVLASFPALRLPARSEPLALKGVFFYD